ncbi:MAG: hypothetical protein HOB81_00930 [Flavobacteriaceae bacterium]|jgi:hypothetical protein|nr:hypothetical protein [Flavobacteriaceae bacterium]MBT5224236.1 hypothetical protein [Candidatus Neomarinimicrobiota bacterium]
MDKLIFKTRITFKDFYNVLRGIDGCESSPYEEMLNYFEEIRDPEFKVVNFDGTSYSRSGILLSEDRKTIVFFKPSPKNIDLVKTVKHGLITNLGVNEIAIDVVEDEDTAYKDDSIYDCTIGLNTGFKIIFNKSYVPISDLFSKFKFNNYEWYKEYEDSENLLEPDSSIPGFIDNYGEVVEITEKNENIILYMKELEQLRFLEFKYLLKHNNLVGFEFLGGSLDLINMTLWELENFTTYDDKESWSIFWKMESGDEILMKSNANYEDLREMIEKTGTKSW